MTTTKTYNLQQIVSAWIVNNNPSAVKAVLSANGLIVPGANPSKADMTKVLYSYYLSNGRGALLTLLKQIPTNPNTSEAQKRTLANSYQEISSAVSGNTTPVYQPTSRVAEASTDKWWNNVIDVVLGSEVTTVAPTVTTTTTTSPLVIGGLIAGVLLVLGLAYFFIVRKAA